MEMVREVAKKKRHPHYPNNKSLDSRNESARQARTARATWYEHYRNLSQSMLVIDPRALLLGDQ